MKPSLKSSSAIYDYVKYNNWMIFARFGDKKQTRPARLQSWALFDEISGAEMLENRSAGAQNSSQVRIKMQSGAQK